MTDETRSALKPRLPDDPPKIAVTLTFRLLHDFSRYSSGSMLVPLKYALVGASDTKTGEQTATLGSSVAGTWFIDSGGRLFAANMEEAARSLLKAIEEQYLPA